MTQTAIRPNTGLLHRTLKGFRAARNGEAEALADLNVVQPDNLVEQTLKDVFSILYAHATDLTTLDENSEARLREIAKLCPLDHGFGVYTARAALLKLDTLPAHYFAECERVPSPEQISEKKLEEKEGDGQFRVYPNPSDGTFDLNYALTEQETGVVEIYSAMGQLVYTLPLQPGAQSSRMTMEHVANGIYHLRVTVNGESRMTTKLIIQN